MEAQSYPSVAFRWLAIFPGITAVASYACCSGTRTKRIDVAANCIALLGVFVFTLVVSPWSGHHSAVFLWPFRGIPYLYWWVSVPLLRCWIASRQYTATNIPIARRDLDLGHRRNHNHARWAVAPT